MKISASGRAVLFGRALTTKEKKEYVQAQEKARKLLGLDKTTATVFDFSVPATTKDTGIGTTFSEDAQKMVGMLKTMCGVNSIQLQPQGEISNYVRSPYSGTSFSLGMHLIDLNKLKEAQYGSLLTDKDISSMYVKGNENSVDYDNIFREGGQKAILEKAYTKFTKIEADSPLKKEYEEFRKRNEYWLERDALYEAAAEANGSEDMTKWAKRDQDIFATKEGDTARIAELKQIKNKSGHNVADLEKFIQFIADKEQRESKAKFNEQGIDVYGDCLIGFSQKDYWAHKSAFYPNYEFGCEIGDGKYSCWSPAIDFNKINGEAGELIYNKFDTFFKRYDGVRIDAAWQFIHPLICEPWKNNGNYVFDESGNKLGSKIHNQPHIADNGRHIIKDIILKAADDNKVAHNKVLLELLGGNSYDSLDAVKGLGTTLIHITRYGSDNWGRVGYYESNGDNKYQNMRPGEYIIGPGTHDDTSLIEQVETGKNRAGYLAYDLKLNKHELEHSPEALSKAIWAELHTTKNQFATLPDILGVKARINTPNTTNGNWIYRVPGSYEAEYHRNLASGKGLNTPDALSKAIKAKFNAGQTALTRQLDRFAEILRQQGPMTTKEADKLNLTS